MTLIRAAVLSAGAWSAATHLPALRADGEVDVVAVTSPRRATVDQLARGFGVPHAFTDWRRALDLAPDIVIVSSPPIAHPDQVLAALGAGAHVLVEKPFATGLADAVVMQAAAESSGRGLLVGFGWSETPVFRYARQQVASGALGPVEQVTAHLAVNTRELLSGGTDGGWRQAGESEPSTYTDPRISGGGSAAVTMSHQLGLVCWITGLRIRRVGAFTSPARSRLDLHTSVVVEFAGGASGALSAASTQPDRPTPQWYVALYGRHGQIHIDTLRNVARWVPATGGGLKVPAEFADGRYDSQAPTKALIACARGDSVPAGMSSELATQVVAVTDAIYTSAEEQRMVDVEYEPPVAGSTGG